VSTIGWILILSAFLVIRQVVKGRVMETPQDIADAFLAMIQGDTQGLGEVLTRTGDSATADQADLSAYHEAGSNVGQIVQGVAAVAGSTILAAAVRRGSSAKGYRWAAAGPDYYDCSGLVFRSLQDVGYKGHRFFTSDFASIKEVREVKQPLIGDIVLWRGVTSGHMGIVSGENKYYSARSVRSGIGYSSISSLTGKGRPRYFRYFPDGMPSASKSALNKQGS
jgi:cell wall-associated NlpC family hydrolase